jgi:Flp pilus assembly protein TadB
VSYGFRTTGTYPASGKKGLDELMLPSSGQAWTYKDRGRVFSLIAALALIVLLVVAIILANWPSIIIAVVGLAGAVLTWFDAERKSKDANEKVKDFDLRHKDQL